MQRFQVTKVIEFSYGHRLLNHDGKCRYLHGHNGMVEVDLGAETLDRMGMVIDFSRVSEVVKTWIDDNLDHRMLLRYDDPMTPVLQRRRRAGLYHGREPNRREHRQADLDRGA